MTANNKTKQHTKQQKHKHKKVADRVLLQAGSRKWWGAVIGRAKAERAARQTSNSTWVRLCVLGVGGVGVRCVCWAAVAAGRLLPSA